jgi:regulatory protein
MSDRIVELKPRPRERVRVTLTGGRFFTIPAAGAETLDVGAVLSDEDVLRLDSMDQYLRGRDKALGLLARRARSRHEIETALSKTGIAPSIRQGLLAELEELGLVDDLRFAREYVRVKSDVKKLGPHRLRHDLRRLGVRRAVVEEVLAESFEGDAQLEMAREVARRRLGGGPVDEKTARRLAGLLRRKGFDYEVVNSVVYEFLQRSRSRTGPEEEQ